MSYVAKVSALQLTWTFQSHAIWGSQKMQYEEIVWPYQWHEYAWTICENSSVFCEFSLIHLMLNPSKFKQADKWQQHCRVVTSSHHITEVKQHRARLVLGQVSGARVTVPAMCEGVGQASHIIPPLSTQQWWVTGGMRKLHCNDWLSLQQSAQMLKSPQRRWDCIRKSLFKGCKLWSLLNSRDMRL